MNNFINVDNEFIINIDNIFYIKKIERYTHQRPSHHVTDKDTAFGIEFRIKNDNIYTYFSKSKHERNNLYNKMINGGTKNGKN